MPLNEGPVIKAVENVLQKIKVHRQAHHGKSFVGNHVHRCCQVSAKQEEKSGPFEPENVINKSEL